VGLHASVQEVLQVTNQGGISETGGGHAQKGVDFQRFWAIMRMFELEEAGAPDFLLLFEAVQDVSELDSTVSPTTIKLYQVKKKDRKEWSWGELTGLPVPPKKGKRADLPDKDKISGSALGKLFLSITAFQALPSEGYFISNAGCNLPLENGGNVATSLPCDLSQLSGDHVSLLGQGLSLIREAGAGVPELKRLKLCKVALPPDAPDVHVVGIAFKFLKSRSPRHASQAQAFVESLIAKVAQLGRHTDECFSFEDLVKERGFSRSEFVESLAQLEQVPDLLHYLDTWLGQLQAEGLDFITVTQMRAAAAAIFRHQLLGNQSDEDRRLADACDAWIAVNSPGNQLRPYLELAFSELKDNFPGFKKHQLLAHFALRGIQRCVDPI